MNKIITLLIFTLFFSVKSFSQLTIKVKVESIAVQNTLDCDAGSSDDSDFLFEFKATDNSVASLTNNAPVLGSIGNCNYAYLNENNGAYTVFTNTPGLAVFSPTNGVFYNHSFNCYQDIPTTLTFVWRGYENDDVTAPSTSPVANGTTVINTVTLALPSNVTNTVLTMQYSATSPDATCDQTYIIKLSVTISTGTFYPLFIEHTHENVICPSGTNGISEVHPAGGSGAVLIDWSNDGVGDFDDLALLSGLTVGSYTVVIKDALSCTATAVSVITSTPAPLSITGFLQSKSNLCQGSSATYEVPTQANASNFLWLYSGTGATFSSTSASLITIAFSGTATSGMLSVSAVNSCSASPTLTMNLTVSSVPNLAIFGSTEVCDNNNSSTIIATGALTYTWNNGTTTASLPITPTATTVYSVTASNNGCKAIGNYTVSVLVSPTVVATVSTASICPNEQTVLIANGSGNLFLWSDGFVGATHTISANVTTIYTVTNTYTNSCYSQSGVAIYVKPTPTISISGNAMACPNKSITLTASGINTYTWSNGFNTSVITFTPNGLATLTLTGIDASTNCLSSKTITINNYTTTAISIAGNPIICSQVITTYTASGYDFYLWDNGATAATNTLMVVGATTIHVVGTTINGCKDSTLLALNVTQTPTVNLSAVDSVCAGQNTIMIAMITGATSYSWSTGATTSSISVAPISNSTYTFTAINGACSNVLTHQIGVKPIPLINFAINPIICSTDQVLILNATPLGGSFNGVNVSGNLFNPSVPNGAYDITYFVTGSNGCLASSSQTINVVYCVGLEEFDSEAVSLNLFPNPVNDAFIVQSDKIIKTLEIIDFTGKVIGMQKVNNVDVKYITSELANGLYTCRVNFITGKQSTLRFVKQ